MRAPGGRVQGAWDRPGSAQCRPATALLSPQCFGACLGARDGNRTRTPLRIRDFKSRASTNSATRAVPNDIVAQAVLGRCNRIASVPLRPHCAHTASTYANNRPHPATGSGLSPAASTASPASTHPGHSPFICAQCGCAILLPCMAFAWQACVARGDHCMSPTLTARMSTSAHPSQPFLHI